MKKYTGLWDEIKNEIVTINGGKEFEYGEYFMKIEFNSGGDLPLNKQLKLHRLTIVVGQSTKKLIFQKKLKLIKQVGQKNVCFVIIGVLKILDTSLNHMFVINVTMY